MAKISLGMLMHRQQKIVFSTAVILIYICLLLSRNLTNYSIEDQYSHNQTSIENNLENILEPENVITPVIDQTVKNITVQKGDTLGKILHKLAINNLEIHALTAELQKNKNLRLNIGQEIELKLSDDLTKILYFKTVIQNTKTIEISKIDDRFQSKINITPLDKKFIISSGYVSNNLLKDAQNNGVPREIINKAIKLLSYQIDFQRDIRANDRYELIYENFYDEKNKLVKSGRLMYASMFTKGKEIKLYNYNSGNSDLDFFNENGVSIKRSFMRTPLNVVRISSKYGMRHHPVLGYSKMHKGVDFAAPTGTPVFAAADGIIEELGYKGSYGKYIKIKHKEGIATAYAHLSKYSKTLKKGMRVKQGEIIGNVGTTGRSTGAHLHFEAMVGGKHINPLSIRATPQKKLFGKELKEFTKHKQEIQNIITNSNDNIITNSDIFKFASK